MLARRSWLSLVFALICVSSSFAEEPKTRLATEGRFDLTPDKDVGRLTEGRVVSGRGRVDRMSWLPVEQRDFGYVVHIAASHQGAHGFVIEFVPEHDGVVTLALKSPWNDSGNGKPYKEEVEWAEIKVDSKPASGFDEGGKPRRVWHDAPAFAEIKVRGGKAVTIAGSVRAVLPEGFVEMKRLGRETSAHQNAKQFLKGVNFGNFLEAPKGQDWGARSEPSEMKIVKKQGFDHVRLPIAWQHYTGAAPDFKIDPELFGTVDALVDAAVAQKLAIILNVHHFDDFTSHPQEQTPKLVAIWKQVSEHYKGRPNSVAFELINEPKDAATTETLNPIYAELIDTIRKTNPKRPIFVGPGLWNRVSELAALRLPDRDENLIVTIHCYDPHLFTHQGAPWAGGDLALLKGVMFPGPPMRTFGVANAKLSPETVQFITAYNNEPEATNPCGPATLKAVVDAAKEWSDYYGRPVHLGEFGVYEAADDNSRGNYCREFRKLLEEAGIGWCLWDWKAGFKYWNPETQSAKPNMHEALFGTEE
jgi:endoglucanase